MTPGKSFILPRTLPLFALVAAHSVCLPQDLHAEDEAPLPIEVNDENSYPIVGDDHRGFRRQTPDLKTRRELSFLGKYDQAKDRIVFLDPPEIRLHIKRQPFWRVSCYVETGLRSFKAIDKKLNSAETAALLKLPAMQAYFKKQEGSMWQIETPKFSLHEVFAGKVPEEFASLDAHKKMDLLQRDDFYHPIPKSVTPEKGSSPLVAGMVATFTGTIHPHLPENIHYAFDVPNLDQLDLHITSIRPVRVLLDEETARRRFLEEVKRATPTLTEICRKNQLIFEFNPGQIPVASWFDGRMVMSGRISSPPEPPPGPPSTNYFAPRPYATVSVFFDPETRKPERIIVVKRFVQNPAD